MDLSIIIVNFEVYDDVIKCINSIIENIKSVSYEIIVVDNNSSDTSIYRINEDFPGVIFVGLKTNRGFGHANNEAMKTAKGDFFLLMNPDIIVQDNSIEEMLTYIKGHSDVSVAGAVQEKPGRGVEYYYTFFPSLYSRFCQEFGFYMTAPVMKYRFFKFWDKNIEKGDPFRVDWVIGSCMLIRKEVYEKLGGFNEAFFLYEEEVDWQYRMKEAGWQSVIVPSCRIIHNHSSSAGKFGYLFVHYHEFRSRIVFSKIHEKGLRYVIRTLMIFEGLILRFIFYAIKYFLKPEILRVRLNLNIDLLKLCLSGRNNVLNKRFDFESSIFNSDLYKSLNR
jgi:GT2 family glycosyltransferase